MYRTIADEGTLKAYGQLAVPALESLGARLLTRSASQIQADEAGLQQRTVVVEFDSYDIALAARRSEAYHEALQAHSVPARSATFASSRARKVSL